MAAVEFAAAGLATHEKADCTLGPERQIRILSVSPDEGDHTELLQILDELPFLLTTARSSREAAACLASGQFAIILCECELPDGNWLEILNRISGRGGKVLSDRHIETRRRIPLGRGAESRRLRPSCQTVQPAGSAPCTHFRVGAKRQSSSPRLRGWRRVISLRATPAAVPVYARGELCHCATETPAGSA